jgi:glycosyltransferase involved in cell wall biosynthesis
MMATPMRILLHYPVLNRGGAERSTLRLLAGLADRGHDVHLVLTVRGGPLESDIDKRVIVHYLRDTVGEFPPAIQNPLDLWRAFSGLKQWTMGRMQQAWRSRSFRNMQFDAAIVGLSGLSPKFICRKISARKRFVFIRNDPGFNDSGRMGRAIQGYHDEIDQYVCVSDYLRIALESMYPSTHGKSLAIYNLLESDTMRANANLAGNPFASNGLPRIVSVCRLQEVSKGLLRMVEVHKRLLDAGSPHEWHVLGNGPDRALLKQAIETHGVSTTFKLHGSIANPFPYYKHADICAVLSRYEGLCGVVNEARVLERPVIATRFSGIEEQITSGVNGLIVEQDVDEICAGLARLLRDAEFRDRLARGGYPAKLLDDEAKLDKLIHLFSGESGSPVRTSH